MLKREKNKGKHELKRQKGNMNRMKIRIKLLIKKEKIERKKT